MKILVIQQKMIGDVLVTSLLCNNLRKAYPHAIIDYMVYEQTVAVLEGNTNINNLILFKEKHRKSKWEFFKFLTSIRNSNYDIVIDCYTKIESLLPVLFSGAKRRISFKKKHRGLFFNETVEKILFPQTNLGLIIEQRLSLLNPLKLNIELDTFPKLFVSDSEKKWAKEVFENNGISFDKKTIMISIIGSSPNKTYPNQYMADVINFIAENYSVNMLFNYIPNQLTQAKAIYDLCSETAKKCIYFDVLGKNLREFIALMHQCNAIVGNDGGAINMAKALNKPSFIIFSPWIDKAGWATFEDGKNHISVHLKEFKPALFSDKSNKEVYAQNEVLYNEFEPELFLNLIEGFCAEHLN